MLGSPARKPQPRKNNDWLIILVLALAGVCCICIFAAAAYFFFASSQQTTALPTDTKVATVIPATQTQIVIRPSETPSPTSTSTLPPTATLTATPDITAFSTVENDCMSHDKDVYIHGYTNDGINVYLNANTDCLELSINGVGTPVEGKYMEDITEEFWNQSFHPYQYVLPMGENNVTIYGVHYEDGMFIYLTWTVGRYLDYATEYKWGDYVMFRLWEFPTETPTFTGTPGGQ